MPLAIVKTYFHPFKNGMIVEKQNSRAKYDVVRNGVQEYIKSEDYLFYLDGILKFRTNSRLKVKNLQEFKDYISKKLK